MRDETTAAIGIAGAQRDGRMAIDVVMLVRRDHEDLDRALAAMTDPTTSPSECASLLDALRIGFVTHAEAQGTVLRRMLGQGAAPALLRAIVAAIFDEHREQARAIASLSSLRPGGTSWLTHALELRVLMLDHASREDLTRTTLCDQVSAPERQALVRGYATERLRRFGTLEPKPRRDGAERWLFN